MIIVIVVTTIISETNSSDNTPWVLPCITIINPNSDIWARDIAVINDVLFSYPKIAQIIMFRSVLKNTVNITSIMTGTIIFCDEAIII